MLRNYVEKTKAKIKKDRITNTKAQRSLKVAEEVL
jgi:ribosomal protein S18